MTQQQPTNGTTPTPQAIRPARKYPIGIQTFERIREEKYLYIDKTDLVWKLTKESPYVFLSRPRRFGKSLLTTTLKSYFEGRKDLFEGLKIMELEQEWESYPVIHLDLSAAAYCSSSEDLQKSLSFLLLPFANQYGVDAAKHSPGILLHQIIQQVYIQTGKKVALLIDEYDAPLLNVLAEKNRYSSYLRVMLELFHSLKGNDAILQFCFITGVTAFPEPATFASFINLFDVSLSPEYATICGITEDELRDTFDVDVGLAAVKNNCTKEEMYHRLKQYYGGYHFARNIQEIYNPHCLVSFLTSQLKQPYWYSSFLPSFIDAHLKQFNSNLNELYRIEVYDNYFYNYSIDMDNLLSLLYQAGYLTIESYDRIDDTCILSIPNTEVYKNLLYGQIPLITGLEPGAVQKGFAVKLWQALKNDDIDTAMQELKSFLAGIPYVEGFKRKLEDAAASEGFYEYTFWLIFNMLNVFVQTQVKCRGGRIDFVVLMPETTYVFELKANGTAQEALDQIKGKGYALPYHTEGRKVVKVGIQFDRDTMTVGEYLVER